MTLDFFLSNIYPLDFYPFFFCPLDIKPPTMKWIYPLLTCPLNFSPWILAIRFWWGKLVGKIADKLFMGKTPPTLSKLVRNGSVTFWKGSERNKIQFGRNQPGQNQMWELEKNWDRWISLLFYGHPMNRKVIQKPLLQ